MYCEGCNREIVSVCCPAVCVYLHDVAVMALLCVTMKLSSQLNYQLRVRAAERQACKAVCTPRMRATARRCLCAYHVHQEGRDPGPKRLALGDDSQKLVPAAPPTRAFMLGVMTLYTIFLPHHPCMHARSRRTTGSFTMRVVDAVCLYPTKCTQ